MGNSQDSNEPVAWIQPDHLQKARKAPFLCRVEPTKRMVDFVPLYAAPPQRKPLTEEDLRKLADKHLFHQPESYEASGVFALSRAVEAAHGIKEGT